MKIETWEQLMKNIDGLVQKNLYKIGERIAEILYDYVEKNWYDTYNPKMYLRTFEVLNSISVSEVKKTATGYEVKVFFDPDKISQRESTWPVPYYKKRFNYHMSINGDKEFKGMSIAEWVVIWMNEGQRSWYYSGEDTHFYEDTLNYIRANKTHIDEMTKLLKAEGLDVKVK